MNDTRPIIGRSDCPPTEPLGLYLHWPFCETKCGYCDFYSVPLGGQDLRGVASALCQELSRRVAQSGPPVKTVFFGGGTPTTLASDLLGEVLAAIRDAIGDETPDEFTVEANPATVDREKARVLVDAGVTRVSLGAQSFHANELAALERLHSPADVPEAVAILRDAGIKNINIDLIFGIPGQTIASWRASLERAIALKTEHIACYGLTYEPNTAMTQRLHQGLVTACDESLEAEQFLLTIDLLADEGFSQYEISNFATAGRQCAHNLIYWRLQPHLAIGPSAAGFTGSRRYRNIAHHGEYVRRVNAGNDPASEHEDVSGMMLALEVLMMGLRLVEGIDLDAFADRTAFDLRIAAADRIAALQQQGLISLDSRRLRMTQQGMLFGDGVIAEIATAIDDQPGTSLPILRTTGGARSV
ncbi:MAG: radical SAM family heme chaperone HemW [Phycisphaerales bacterium]|nr:radical SAM family heme chaperone HemW [Phycisphaerales bacterium]